MCVSEMTSASVTGRLYLSALFALVCVRLGQPDRARSHADEPECRACRCSLIRPICSVLVPVVLLKKRKQVSRARTTCCWSSTSETGARAASASRAHAHRSRRRRSRAARLGRLGVPKRRRKGATRKQRSVRILVADWTDQRAARDTVLVAYLNIRSLASLRSKRIYLASCRLGQIAHERALRILSNRG